MTQELEETKIYANNNQINQEAIKDAISILGLTKNEIIDLGSDKPPRFAQRISMDYPESCITHFRDVKTIGKVSKTDERENLRYIYDRKDLKNKVFDAATAVFSLHEYKKKWRKPELKILYEYLKPNGRIIVFDYDLKWVKKEKINVEEFKREVFTDSNERKVMVEEPDFMKTHTSCGLEDCIKNCLKVGFNKILTKQYHIQTSWGVKPKVFLYIGEKV